MDISGLIEKRNRKGTLYYENHSGDIVAKTCTKCNELKSLSDFYVHKIRLGGRKSECIVCSEIYAEANREHRKEQARKYREENKEQINERLRQRRKENPEPHAISTRKWRKANKEKLDEYMRKWRQDNRDMLKAYRYRRAAQLRSLPASFTENQMNEILEYFGGGCALTGSSDYSWDHVVPLSVGKGGTVIGNMVPLRSDLNHSKKSRDIFSWFESNKQRFELSEEKFNALIDYLAKSNDMTVKDYRNYVRECHDDNGGSV